MPLLLLVWVQRAGPRASSRENPNPVGVFETLLRTEVMIAFFMPGIVCLADAVGTQTEAVVIRGLSVGVPIGNLLRRKILTESAS